MQQVRQHGPTAARVFDIKSVEHDIETTLREQHHLPPRQLPPLLPSAQDVGRLTAEAITGQYELAAKEVEAMGTELKARIDDLEATKTDAIAAIEEIKETAASYREEGKRIALQIKDCSEMTKEVRTTCTELKAKIAGPT